MLPYFPASFLFFGTILNSRKFKPLSRVIILTVLKILVIADPEDTICIANVKGDKKNGANRCHLHLLASWYHALWPIYVGFFRPSKWTFGV